MITYKAEDVQWFNANVPYVPTNQQLMRRRLDDAISHRDCLDLAEASDNLTVWEIKLGPMREEVHAQQEQAKCAAIRAYNPDAQDEQRRRVVNDRVNDWVQRAKAYEGILVALICFAACLLSLLIGRR